MLGAILANNKAHERVRDFLKPEHFADPINGMIYDRIDRRIKAGRLADAVTLKDDLADDGMLAEVGGTAYLTQLLAAMVGIIGAGEYGRTIYDCWRRRRLIEISTDMIQRAYAPAPGSDGTDQASAAIADLSDVANDVTDETLVCSIGNAAKEAVERAERIARGEPVKGVTTGWDEIDQAIGPMMDGHLLILGGRARMGKTALAMQIATCVADRLAAETARGSAFDDAAGDVLVWSYEMAAIELGGRAAAAWSRVPYDSIAHGRISLSDGEALRVGLAKLAGLPIWIADPKGMTAEAMIAQTRAIAKHRRLRLVVTDHLQKLRAPSSRRRQDYLPEAASHIKDAAADIGVPWLLLSQLVREADRRPDPTPILADLAYTGEADADVVMLMWRPELYIPKSPPDDDGRSSPEALDRRRQRYYARKNALKDKAELIVAKHRHGKESTRMLAFNGAQMRFATPITADDDPDLYEAAQ